MTTTVDILKAAKKKIDAPEKWFRHDYQDESGLMFCAIGAVREVTRTAKEESLGLAAIHNALPHGSFNIAWYNDRPSTTHADIMRLYDRAIMAEAVRENAKWMGPRR